MSTRSGIGMEREDGTVAGIYCHYDGYLEGVGKTLDEHYRQAEKVAALVSLGSASSLGNDIGEKHPFNDRPEGWTTFYGRDRGEKDTGPTVAADVEGFREALRRSGVEFFYLFAGGRWSVSRPWGRWKPLADVLARGLAFLDEPDPDRGPDVLYGHSIDNPGEWLVADSSSVGGKWMDENGKPEGMFLLRHELVDLLDRMRRDGLIIDETEWEPT